MTTPLGAQPGGPDGDPIGGLRDLLRTTRPDADAGLIRRAYDAAEYWHRGQLRLSGDPYITHPVAVATILAGLGADDQTLCAAMLHDMIEDTSCTLAVLNRGFGAEIAAMVAEFTRLHQLRGRRRLKVARVRAAARSADPRVLAVSLADRLHNMRTLQFLTQAKQLRKAREALELFVPVARQLNLDAIRSELETLASAALQRNRRVDTLSGRVLSAAASALLPVATRTRWREEWLAELHTLPGRRDRARFAAHTLLGVPRLAVTLRLPAGSGRAC